MLLVAGAAAVAALLAGRDEEGPEPSAAEGAALFRKDFTPSEGLGPLFNERSCAACHLEPSVGGVGRDGLATVLRIGRLTDDGFDAMVGRGGPFAHAHSIAELGARCDRAAGVPEGANVTSVRNAQQLFGAGLIDAIPDDVIRAQPKRAGVNGRPNVIAGRVGRFGWKADVPTLERFVSQALRNEIGITSDLAGAPRGRCTGERDGPEVGPDVVKALAAFVASLPAPRPTDEDTVLFVETGCAACHVPALHDVPLYSDLLLHDMGRSLDDRVSAGVATGAEWRTAPLWGLKHRKRLLHDARATTIEAAILAHGGEAEQAVRRFRALAPDQSRRLLAFLRTL